MHRHAQRLHRGSRDVGRPHVKVILERRLNRFGPRDHSGVRVDGHIRLWIIQAPGDRGRVDRVVNLRRRTGERLSAGDHLLTERLKGRDGLGDRERIAGDGVVVVLVFLDDLVEVIEHTAEVIRPREQVGNVDLHTELIAVVGGQIPAHVTHQQVIGIHHIVQRKIEPLAHVSHTHRAEVLDYAPTGKHFTGRDCRRIYERRDRPAERGALRTVAGVGQVHLRLRCSGIEETHAAAVVGVQFDDVVLPHGTTGGISGVHGGDEPRAARRLVADGVVPQPDPVPQLVRGNQVEREAVVRRGVCGHLTIRVGQHMPTNVLGEGAEEDVHVEPHVGGTDHVGHAEDAGVQPFRRYGRGVAVSVVVIHHRVLGQPVVGVFKTASPHEGPLSHGELNDLIGLTSFRESARREVAQALSAGPDYGIPAVAEVRKTVGTVAADPE